MEKKGGGERTVAESAESGTGARNGGFNNSPERSTPRKAEKKNNKNRYSENIGSLGGVGFAFPTELLSRQTAKTGASLEKLEEIKRKKNTTRLEVALTKANGRKAVKRKTVRV